MNKVVLKGNLVKDPERVSEKVVRFSIATNDGTKEKPKTNFHSVTVFGKLSDTVEKFFVKGQEILIEGMIDYSKHEDKYYTNILLHRFYFCGSKSEGRQEMEKQEDDLPF